ncbi:MAG TPA: hypothetical protein VFU69_18615 [Ktedonobacterales bacterium]|nr:hypothetical protein [Ktedonobacterales bacterium]
MQVFTRLKTAQRALLIGLPVLLILFTGGAFLLTNAHASSGSTTSSAYSQPTWWAKYQRLQKQTASPGASSGGSLTVGTNVDMSNEDGPQSETSITVNPNNPKMLVGGSNEIVRLPMRGYFSSDGGKSWGAVDIPLPPAASTNGVDFGSDPGVAFDTQGNVYYSYIVVFLNQSFTAFVGSEMAVAKSTDGGKTWPQVTFFNFNSGNGKFNDKPMIAVDTNPNSPFRDSVYVAWDTVGFGKSSSNDALVFSRSTDGGKTFSSPIALNDLTGGPHQVIGADPFVGPNGEVYVAWHDVQSSQLMVASSFDGGASFNSQQEIAPTQVVFDDGFPSMESRRALLYPACGADNSASANRGTLYCSWMDETAANGADIFVARSTDRGATWGAPVRVNDDPAGVRKDQFNQWLSVDPTTGSVNLSWNDARNDPADTKTDIYFAQSTNGGLSFAANLKVTTAMTDESAANPNADAGNQYGDYEGIVAFGGVIHPIWTDGRFDGTVDAATGQLLNEEVFTATIS